MTFNNSKFHIIKVFNNKDIIMNNDMRKLLGIMRGNNTNNNPNEQVNKNLTMRELLGKMRRLNEQKTEEDWLGNDIIVTPYYRRDQEKDMISYLTDLQINQQIDFIPLELKKHGAFWGGTLGNQLQWVYKITPDESISGVEFNYLDGFNPNNDSNKKIINAITNYYDDFYKKWLENAEGVR